MHLCSILSPILRNNWSKCLFLQLYKYLPVGWLHQTNKNFRIVRIRLVIFRTLAAQNRVTEKTTGQAVRVQVIFLIFCLPVNYEFVIFVVPKYLCKVMRSVLHIHLVHLVYHHVSIRLKLIYRHHNQPIQYPKIKYLNS